MKQIKHNSQKPALRRVYRGAKARGKKFLFWILNSVFCILFHFSIALAGEFQVGMKDWEFHPDILTIQQGDTVLWVNNDDSHHKIIFEDASIKNSENIKPEQKFSVVFDRAGDYKYYCKYHRDYNMRGMIIVR